MVETRKTRSKGTEVEAPAAKRQRRGDRDGDEDGEGKKRLAAGVEERHGSEQSESDSARLSNVWDAFFREHFFFRPPSEFYALYELARSVNEEKPLDAFVASAGVRLSGPFELLSAGDAGNSAVETQSPLFLHGRFPNDPPEVLTALVDASSNAGQHWGYFRDAPEQDARYVVCCPDSSKVKFEIAGASLLHVVSANMQRGASETLQSQINALIAEHCGDKKDSAGQLKKQREREVTAPSLHGLGIVMPVNTKTETGFRELPVTGADLAALLENVRADPSDTRSRGRVSELLTRATIASDECDFGTGLLLGLDLLTAGPCLQKEAMQLLRVAYGLLRRGAFFKIVKGQWAARSPMMQQPLQALVAPNEGAPKTVVLPSGRVADRTIR